MTLSILFSMECHYTERHYAECYVLYCYAVCHYAECPGVLRHGKNERLFIHGRLLRPSLMHVSKARRLP